MSGIRRLQGLLFGSIAVFIYLFTVVYIEYIKTVQAKNYVDWDVKTITAGDYTIEFDIEEDAYERWKKTYYDETNPIAEVAQFKIYLQNDLERRINEMPDQQYDEPDQRDYWKKIAQITFAYSNAEVVQWLIDRGYYIKNEKWDKVAKIEASIVDKLQDDKSDLLDKLQRPCSAFVTWDSEEALRRAENYCDWCAEEAGEKEVTEKFLGNNLELQNASEPSDIIWENRQFTPRQRNAKRVAVLLLIFTLLTLSGAIIFKCTKTSLALKGKYPVVSCSMIAKLYKTTEFKTNSDWQTAAIKEYGINKNYENQNKTTHYTGSMQCFCEAQKHNKANLTHPFKVEIGNTQNCATLV